MKTHFYIYVYLRQNGTPYYIGKGSGNRVRAKRRSGVNPPRNPEQIKILKSGLSEKEAFEWECDLIQLLGRLDLGTGCLRNKTNGGEGTSGVVKSKETRLKLSLATRGQNNPHFGKFGSDHPSSGRVVTKKTRQKISVAGKGRVVPQEVRLKISLALSGENNPRYGKKDSKETRLRKSNVHKGKSWWVNKKGETLQSEECPGPGWIKGRGEVSEETLRKMTEMHKGKSWWVNREGKTSRSEISPGPGWKRGRTW